MTKVNVLLVACGRYPAPVKMSAFRVICYLTIAVVIGFATRATWLSFLRADEPGPGFSRGDGITVLIADASASLDVKVTLSTYVRSSPPEESDKRITGGTLVVNITVPTTMVRTTGPDEYTAGDVFTTSTGAGAELVQGCQVLRSQDAASSVRDDVAFAPRVDALLGFSDAHSAIWRVRSSSFDNRGGEISFTVTCQGESRNLWTSYLDTWYLRSLPIRVFGRASDPATEFADRQYCTAVSSEVQRGMVLQNSVPDDPATDTKRAFFDPDSLWIEGDVPVIYLWQNCVELDDGRAFTIRPNDEDIFGRDFYLNPSVVEATFTNTRERRTIDRNLFLGGASLGLVAAFVVEGIGSTIGLLEGLLRSTFSLPRRTIMRLRQITRHFGRARRRKERYEQMTLF